MPATVVKPRRLYEEVAERLEQAIGDGTYAAADLLPSERDLMREFGVGRPAVREALSHLGRMGLVEIRSGERARVTTPTPQFVIGALSGTARHILGAPGGVRNFQNARLFFEVGLARHAARHATAGDIAQFEAALVANRQAIGDLKRFQKTDVAFHYVLALIPGNPIFTAFHAALAEWLLEQRRTTLARGEDLRAYEAHRKIFEAVAARDADDAEQAMRKHLEHVAHRYEDVIGGRG